MMSGVCDGDTLEVCAFGNKPVDALWSSTTGTQGGASATMGRTVHSLLFIEDDDHIRLALRLALEDEGYDVVEAPAVR